MKDKQEAMTGVPSAPSERCDEDPPWPGATTLRLTEILNELSLIDLCRLVCSKANGSQGLSLQGAAVMEVETATIKLTVRRKKLRLPRKKLSRKKSP